jgi:2-hydroxy-6-oxo-octa-2,4-dienoate hydrolase
MSRTVLPRDGIDLSIDGERVHYVEQGVGDAVVLIHGFPSSAQLTYGRLLPLLPTNRRVVAIDLVGLGWSDRDSKQPCDPQAQAPRILKVMDALGIDRATVVGSSFGGAVAQHVALGAPERVERLVLLASVDANDPPQSWRKEWLFAVGIVSLLTAMRFPWVGQRLRLKVGKPYTGWSTTWGEHEALEATRYTQLPGTARSAFKIMRDMSRAEGVDTSLITVPTLVVSGAADSRMPPRIGEAIAGRIGNSRHVVLPECPHGLPTHQPEAIAQLLADP